MVADTAMWEASSMVADTARDLGVNQRRDTDAARDRELVAAHFTQANKLEENN